MTPQLVLGLEGVEHINEIYIGDAHACVISDNAKLLCWGWNHAAQCLVESGQNHGVPVNVLKSLTL